MKVSRGLSPSFEGISFQNTGLLFKELTLAFSKLEQTKDATKEDIRELGFPAIVKRHTGLTITFNVEEELYANAFVIPPTVDKNHPLIRAEWREWVGNKDGQTLLNVAKGGVLKGSVNLATSTVSGVFSDLVSPVYVTTGLLYNSLFSAGEKAAIFLHELGHIFTYCEFLGFTITTNIVMHAASEALFAEQDVVRKYQIVQDTSKALGIKFDDPDALVKCGNKEVLRTVILREALIQTPSQGGSSIYDLTGWEALSDQFATRHGAGRDLVTALNKIMRSGFHPSYQPTIVHLVLTAIKVIYFIFVVVFSFGIGLILLCLNPAIKVYDDPEARLMRIRRDLAGSLKDPKLGQGIRLKVLEDLEIIDVIVKPVKDKRGMLELFHTAILPGGRRQYSQLKFQLDLEKLVNNDLFVAAAQFKSLSA